MGVPGLWDLLRPAATRTSLSTLAREAFYSNENGRRALTIGIDASIWIFHAQIPQYGENPFMRTIFFKITSLLQHPVLPVFVFDGPNKPSRKRGEKVAGQFGTSDYRSRQFKELLDACGLEWWNAPGEAEAELAVMSRQGKIDAVLSDDVDALLFGATCLLRNNSPTLSGAQASSTQANSSKSDLRHYEMYRSSAIVKLWTEKEGTSLKTEEDCRMAMVWIALLGGGDYAPEGLAGFGSTITYALANSGLADFLRRYKAGQPVNAADVARVHALMIDELRTNASGHLGRRYPARASELQVKDPMTLFPAFALDAYLRPPTSSLDDPEKGWPGFGKGEAVYQKRGKARSEGRGDLEGFAKACEKFFEWGTKDLVAKKFASESVGLFGSELVTCARERVRLRDPMSPSKAKTKELEKGDTPGGPRITSFFQSTPSSSRPTKTRKSFTDMPSHVIKIHSSRPDPTNIDLKDFRISFSPTAYIERCHAVMDGHRVDPKELDITERANLGLVDKEGVEKEDTAPAAAVKSEVRLWIAEYLVQEAWPELITAYEEELAAKSKPKAKKVVKRNPKAKAGGENAEAFKSFFTKPTNQTQSRTQAQTQRPMQSQRALSPEEEEETIEWRPPSSRSSSLTPPPPSSPLLSLGRIKKATRPRPPSSTSASSSRPPTSKTSQAGASNKTDSPAPVPAKSPPPRRGPRRSARFKQAKACTDVIDLCSSDEESLSLPPSSPPRPRRALAATSRTNASPLAPTTRSKAISKSTAKGRQPLNQSQSLLSMPVIRPMSTYATPSPTKVIEEQPKEAKKKNKEKEKAPLYLVTYEDDQVVELDVRGRWIRGESVGPWEDDV